jgi:exodeoxyribonuclease VII large subunit
MAFLALKQKLQAEGLFDPQKKRPLPRWPRRIGIATSPTGAAIRDILRVAHRRGRMHFLVAACQVQGDSAPFEIVRAIRALERVPDVDLIVVGRGGGSAEDLAAFNDEGVARAIAACRVPVVSAVGHEVDVTIADLVADHRAPTPSAAAELIVPSWAELRHHLDEAQKRVLRAGRRAIGEARQRLDAGEERAAQALRTIVARRRRALDELNARLLAQHPRARVARDRAALAALTHRLEVKGPARLTDARRQLEALSDRLVRRTEAQLADGRRALAVAAGRLDALSPLGVLTRGYSLTRTADGHVVTRAADVAPGDRVTITLREGALDATVDAIKKE